MIGLFVGFMANIEPNNHFEPMIVFVSLESCPNSLKISFFFNCFSSQADIEKGKAVQSQMSMMFVDGCIKHLEEAKLSKYYD